MTILSPKEAQLLAALNQVLYEVRNTIPLNARDPALRRSIREADQIAREVANQAPVRRTKV